MTANEEKLLEAVGEVVAEMLDEQVKDKIEKGYLSLRGLFNDMWRDESWAKECKNPLEVRLYSEFGEDLGKFIDIHAEAIEVISDDPLNYAVGGARFSAALRSLADEIDELLKQAQTNQGEDQ
jgi:hypothetical protein